MANATTFLKVSQCLYMFMYIVSDVLDPFVIYGLQ